MWRAIRPFGGLGPVAVLQRLPGPRHNVAVRLQVMSRARCGWQCVRATSRLTVPVCRQSRAYSAARVGGEGTPSPRDKEHEQERKVEKRPAEPSRAQPAKPAGWHEVFRLLRLVKPDWKLLLAALGLLTISCSIGMAVPKVIGLVLDATKDAVAQAEKNETGAPMSLLDMPPIIGNFTLVDVLAAFAGALLVGSAANFGRMFLLKMLGERLVARLRAQVIKKTLHHDAEFFDRNKVGDLISRLGSDAYIVSRSMTQNISDGVKAALCGGVGVGMMFHISSTLTSAMIMFAPPLLIAATIYGKRIRAISRELQQSTGNLTRVSEEQFNGIKTIKSFVAEGKEMRRYNTAVRRLFNVAKREGITSATFFSGTNVLGDVSFLLVLAYGSHLVLQGELSLGSLTAFMLYTEYTGSSVFGLSNFYSELMKGAGAASRLFELTDYKNSVPSTVGQTFVPRDGRIEFKDVSFSYPTRPTSQIFKKLRLTITPGSNVCIVGPSGRGKSTIASLLLRFYDANSGTILIDGQDISKVSAKSLRKHLGVVQQEPVLMSGTIRDNITYGLSYTPSMDEIRAVAKKCFCHNFITKFPDGYDTVIGPRGALLSGGQRQRIAIARALIKKPKILILDEATSALDVESEGAINYTLGRLMRSKEITIVSIAHRLSTIRRSENIVVLGNDGSVIEAGKFADLYRDEDSELFKLLNEHASEPAKPEASPAPAQEEASAPQAADIPRDIEGGNLRLNEEVIKHVLEDTARAPMP
ncbi:ACR022Wp [Eremothecium gossypii ATCC 10895]|uniref:ACR022Wp n=1 Tax=Eremothecium gossypii (strain ATCC 10895 / CBS 109.51 / FGSC 9923 / NRRL Y-1056) TaxID=284811 RepID=Q75C94_EREGS|nr:ACR022Wp [Eremothecium gossypii ATCC 10895]AAS51249.2 ACR022Wp [Eremothecium gossypii ATCC 10895]